MVRAAVAAVAIAIGAGGYALLTTHAVGGPSSAEPDHVSDAERQQRLQTFVSLGPVALRAVEPTNINMAIDTMGLTPEGKRGLLVDLQIPAPPQSPAQQTLSATKESVESAEAKPLVTRKDSLRLAWITLWDTDVEDGDVVRIDCEGYSRTVTLTKRGNTFAVPVPPSGIITVTGIKDGDGGGITVGLASGTAKAVFPIMSIGQTLGLTVKID